MSCEACGEWNAPRAPFKVFGNTYFVGPQGLSSLLVVTSAGLVLVDVPLPQSVAPIVERIQSLGFRPADIKYVLTSHGHFDHVGGVHAMQQFNGITVLASARTADAMALGHPVTGDPQFGTGPEDSWPAVKTGVRVMRDRESVTLGGTTFTAHYTPGHTPGATSWTWKSCEGDRCLDTVYVDSLTAISKDGYRFTGGNGVPGIVDGFRASIGRVRQLPCDIVLSTHPGSTGMDEKLEVRARKHLSPGANGDPFVDNRGCAALADRAEKALDERVRQEGAAGARE